MDLEWRTAMEYQNTFQNNEEPANTHLSCFGYYTKAGNQYPLHCHAYYEILFLVSGKRCQIVDGKRYQIETGSFFLIPPLHIHGYQNEVDCEDLVIQFSSNFLQHISPLFDRQQMLELSGNQTPYLKISSDLEVYLRQLYESRRYDKIDSFCRDMAEDWEMVSMFMNLLSQLLKRGEICVHEGNVEQNGIPQLKEVIDHIMTHPTDKLDMHEAARISGISYYNFSRFFNKATGMGYAEYCNLLRIRHTEELLIHSDMRIDEVAQSIGIVTASYFSRLFKKINGISPMQYRKKYQSKKK